LAPFAVKYSEQIALRNMRGTLRVSIGCFHRAGSEDTARCSAVSTTRAEYSMKFMIDWPTRRSVQST
jgi:hypothetical protein